MTERRLILVLFLVIAGLDIYGLHQLGRILREAQENRRLIAGVEANYDASATFRRLTR
jgi:hypothetical protein